jgi:hypothetical protein
VLVDSRAQVGDYVFIPAINELPEELYRTLKARAALGGITLRELVQRLIEAGAGLAGGGAVSKHRSP